MSPTDNDHTDSDHTDRDRAVAEDRVVIEVPRDTRFVALLRTAAVGVVAEDDPDIETVDNLRLAVDEVVSAVMESSHAPKVSVAYELGRADTGDAELLVTVTPSEVGDAVEPDVLMTRILDSVTASHAFGPDGSAEVRIRRPR